MATVWTRFARAMADAHARLSVAEAVCKAKEDKAPRMRVRTVAKSLVSVQESARVGPRLSQPASPRHPPIPRLKLVPARQVSLLVTLGRRRRRMWARWERATGGTSTRVAFPSPRRLGRRCGVTWWTCTQTERRWQRPFVGDHAERYISLTARLHIQFVVYWQAPVIAGAK